MARQVCNVIKKELARLKALHKKKTPNLVGIKNQQRVGKSWIINFFVLAYLENRLWDFTGLVSPASMNDHSNQDNFAHKLATYLKLPLLHLSIGGCF